MITQSDFIKKFPLLSVEERQVLAKKVIEYKDNVLPSLREAKVPWDKDAIAAFDEGLMLISTMYNARSFCFVAYQFRDIKKRLNCFDSQFDKLINALVSSGDIEQTIKDSAYAATPPSSFVIGKSFRVKPRTGKVGRPTKPQNVPVIAAAGVKDSILRPQDAPDPLRPTLPDRPRHFADYKHLLPPNLQREGEKISDMYLEMADIANKLDLLCDDPEKSTQKDRAFFAVKLCNTEDKIRNLWNRIDVAYAEATGKSVSTDYKAFLDAETKRINGEVRERALSEMSKFEIENILNGEAQAKAKEARILRNKKHLRRTDLNPNDTHRLSLIEAAKELHDWGIAITDSQAKACAMYGYEVPEDWIELPVEERKRLREKARNEQKKQERAKAREERKAAKAAAIAEAMAPYKGDDSLSLFSEDKA